jgi:hypothetical protein
MSEVTEYVSSGNGHQNWHKVDGRYKSSIQDSILFLGEKSYKYTFYLYLLISVS